MLRCVSLRAIAARPDVAYQVNALTELDVARGAHVVWARLQAESEAALHLSSFVVRLAQDASLDHVAVNAGAAVARWQGFATVAGRGVEAGFNGATMLSGKEHGDTTLVMNHAEPGASSRELFKTVIDDAAEGAFQGRIVVQPGAQKTDAKMMTQALLLSDDAQFASKPELEIFADDVQCGHGATTGRIDAAMLFYLMARGIPRAEAERLLVEAFLDDADRCARRRGDRRCAEGRRRRLAGAAGRARDERPGHGERTL